MQPWEFVTEGITNPMDKCTRHLALRVPSDYLLVQYIDCTIPPWNEYMALRESGTLLISIVTRKSSDMNWPDPFIASLRQSRSPVYRCFSDHSTMNVFLRIQNSASAPHLHVYVSLLGANVCGPPFPHSNASNADELCRHLMPIFSKEPINSSSYAVLPPVCARCRCEKGAVARARAADGIPSSGWHSNHTNVPRKRRSIWPQ